MNFYLPNNGYIGIMYIDEFKFQAAPFILGHLYRLKTFNNPFSAIEYSVLFEYMYFNADKSSYDATKSVLEDITQRIFDMPKYETSEEYKAPSSLKEARDLLIEHYKKIALFHNNEQITKIIQLRAMKWTDFQF